MNLEIKNLKIKVSDEIGNISAILIMPEKAGSLIVLSHGAGAGMKHAFMEGLAKSLANHKIATLRFNFPYMEKGGGPPDRPRKAHPAIKAAVQIAKNHAGELPLFAGGKSFGGRMTSQIAAKGELPDLKGIVYYGFPLHPPGKASISRATHLPDIKIAQLFLQGTRDKLATMELMQQVCQGVSNAQLEFLEGADHSFKTLKSSGISHDEMIDRLARLTSMFCEKL